MLLLSQILRSIALSILFGGSAMIVFSAVTLVKAAEARGIPVHEAAMNNVPMFLNYSSVALGAAILLLIAESVQFAKVKSPSKLLKLHWGSCLITVGAVMVLSFGIVPMMRELIPIIHTNEEAEKKFQTLHHASEADFGTIILFALISTVLPAFHKRERDAQD